MADAGDQPEIPNPAEDILKTAIWWTVSADVRSMLSPSDIVLHHNLEVLSVQIQKQMQISKQSHLKLAQLETSINKLLGLHGAKRRGSRTSLSSMASDAVEGGDDEEDVPQSQEQRRYQTELQGPQWGSVSTDQYNKWIREENKTPYQTRTENARRDAEDFRKYLQDTPVDEGGIGADHPYIQLVNKTTEDTFLAMYVELGKTHAAKKKAAAKTTQPKKSKKQVKTTSASQKTIVHVSSDDDDESGESSDNDDDDNDDDDNDDDNNERPTRIEVIVHSPSKKKKTVASRKSVKGLFNTPRPESQRDISNASTQSKRSASERMSPTFDKDEPVVKKRSGHRGSRNILHDDDIEDED